VLELGSGIVAVMSVEVAAAAATAAGPEKLAIEEEAPASPNIAASGSRLLLIDQPLKRQGVGLVTDMHSDVQRVGRLAMLHARPCASDRELSRRQEGSPSGFAGCLLSRRFADG